MSKLQAVSASDVKVACQDCSLATLCLPLGLEEGDIEKLDSIVKRARPLHKGDHLFRQGEPFSAIYAVKTGSLKSYVPGNDGAEQVLGFHLPGELLGLDAIKNGVHGCSAKVLETSAICSIPFDRLEALSVDMPSLQRQLLRLMSQEISAESSMLMLLSKRSAEERLAAFLLSLSKRFSRRGFAADDFYLSMSRNEIGNYLGLAVETVSRLFTRFQEQKLLKVDRKHIRLKNKPGLEAICQAGSGCRSPQKAQKSQH